MRRHADLEQADQDTGGNQDRRAGRLLERRQTKPGSYCNNLRYAEDQNYYEYQAGPVSLHSGKHCIEVIGSITWNGHYNTVRTGGRDHMGRFC